MTLILYHSSLSDYIDADDKLELEMSLRKEFDDYGKADLSVEDIW